MNRAEIGSIPTYIGGGTMPPTDANVKADEWLAEAARQYDKRRYSAARAAAAIARAWAVIGGSTVNEP